MLGVAAMRWFGLGTCSSILVRGRLVLCGGWCGVFAACGVGDFCVGGFGALVSGDFRVDDLVTVLCWWGLVMWNDLPGFGGFLWGWYNMPFRAFAV